MGLQLSDVKELLARPELQQIQDQIVGAVGDYVNRDHADKQQQFLWRDLGLSGVPKEELRSLLEREAQAIVALGVALLRDAAANRKEYEKEEYPDGEKPASEEKSKTIAYHGVGDGFGLTYAVYLYFIRNRSRKEFTEYLKKVHIPGAAAFARRLVTLSKPPS
jgi:hypothetical protein